jgi:hypothetical protein
MRHSCRALALALAILVVACESGEGAPPAASSNVAPSTTAQCQSGPRNKPEGPPEVAPVEPGHHDARVRPGRAWCPEAIQQRDAHAPNLLEQPEAAGLRTGVFQ